MTDCFLTDQNSSSASYKTKKKKGFKLRSYGANPQWSAEVLHSNCFSSRSLKKKTVTLKEEGHWFKSQSRGRLVFVSLNLSVHSFPAPPSWPSDWPTESSAFGGAACLNNHREKKKERRLQLKIHDVLQPQKQRQEV